MHIYLARTRHLDPHPAGPDYMWEANHWTTWNVEMGSHVVVYADVRDPKGRVFVFCEGRFGWIIEWWLTKL